MTRPAETCPCGAPATEAGMCAFCAQWSAESALTIIRRQRDKIDGYKKALRQLAGEAHRALQTKDGTDWPGALVSIRTFARTVLGLPPIPTDEEEARS